MRRKIRQAISGVLVLVLGFSLLLTGANADSSSDAATYTSGNFMYQLVANRNAAGKIITTAVITGVIENLDFIEIPQTIEGYEVTAIGDMALVGEGLEEVHILENVTDFGTYAVGYRYNEAGDLVANPNVWIYGEAESAAISYAKACQINYGIYDDCVYQYLREGALVYQIQTYCPEGSLRPNAILIGVRNEIDRTTVTQLEIPDEITVGKRVLPVTYVAENAFAGCTGLTQVELPASLTQIGNGAFADCTNLTEIRFLGSAPVFETENDSNGAQFRNVTADIYVPFEDSSWTDALMQNYGGTIRWINHAEEAEIAQITYTGNTAYVPEGVILAERQEQSGSVIALSFDEDQTIYQVELSEAALCALVEGGKGIQIPTASADVTLNAKALVSLLSETENGILLGVDGGIQLTAKQKAGLNRALSDQQSSVVQSGILSLVTGDDGDELQLAAGKITLSVPVQIPSNQTVEDYQVFAISWDGSQVEEVRFSVQESCFVFAVSGTSTYAIVYTPPALIEEEPIPSQSSTVEPSLEPTTTPDPDISPAPSTEPSPEPSTEPIVGATPEPGEESVSGLPSSTPYPEPNPVPSTALTPETGDTPSVEPSQELTPPSDSALAPIYQETPEPSGDQTVDPAPVAPPEEESTAPPDSDESGEISESVSSEPACDGGADCPSAAFYDVDTSKWYHEIVDYAVSTELMAGYGDGTFGPDDSLTRGMLVQILYRQNGLPPIFGLNPFLDVPSNTWYTNAVIWAYENGIVSGYGDGKFGAEDDITREQLAAILWSACGKPATTQETLNFDDAWKVSDWAWNAMIWANEVGIMTGNGDGTISPTQNATRAEAACMLRRYLELGY